MADRHVELFWEELIQFVAKGRVVPVVGQDLLVLHPPDSPPVHLYRYLARIVAARLEVQEPPPDAENPLNFVACALGRGRDTNEFHKHLLEAMREVEQQRLIPEPLQLLAKITDFRLFLSTTFDPLLASAIDRERFEDRARTEIFSFSPYGTDDLPDRVSAPTVFHLLGRLQFAGQYAITEEDTLEFVHALQSDSKRPGRLFDELNRRHLLILGSGFSDWLARFFIRTTKSQRLWPTRQPVDFVADSAVKRHASLTEFLHQFSTSTRVFRDDVDTFVRELYRRWRAHRLAATNAQPERTDLPLMRQGAIFLSYASEDRDTARVIAEQLRRANLEVWFDRIELEPGDPWQNKILLNISNASAFVPVISKNTLTRQQRFFRVEWEHAADIACRFPADYRFIYPVHIDDTHPDHPSLPAALRNRQSTPAPAGCIEPALLASLVNAYRAYQLEVLAGA
jgi:TIR domain/SIR2-like domain